MTSPRAFVVLALGLCIMQQLGIAHAMYGEGDGVKILTSDTFEKEIIGYDGPALVGSYRPHLSQLHLQSPNPFLHP